MKKHTFVEDINQVEHYFTLVLNSKGEEVSREYKFSRAQEVCHCGCKQKYPGKSFISNTQVGTIKILGVTRG